jgi:hypothetical protein
VHCQNQEQYYSRLECPVARFIEATRLCLYGHVVANENTRCVYKILVGNPFERGHLDYQEGDCKITVMGCENGRWMELARDRIEFGIFLLIALMLRILLQGN